MSKTKTISVQNLKAIQNLEVDFNGCSAIICAGNNKGKTTFLRGIVDRIRGEKPELIVKEGEKDGIAIMELTTGEKFIWEFDVLGKDKLTFVSPEGFKSSVTKKIVEKFFPPVFDVDDFLRSQPKQQKLMLQKLVGLDFTTIDKEYETAYNERTIANKLASDAKVIYEDYLPIPEKVETVDSTDLIKEKEALRNKLNAKYLENKAANDKLRTEFEALKEAKRIEIRDFNTDQNVLARNKEAVTKCLQELIGYGYKGGEVSSFIEQLPSPKPHKELSVVNSIYFEENPDAAARFEIENTIALIEPSYITELPDDSEMKIIDEKINNSNKINESASKYQDYLSKKNAYVAADESAIAADEKVKGIEERKMNMIKSAKMPEGFTLTDEGILVDGLPLDKNQLSTSKVYCAALRLAEMTLGEVKTLHFDASPLDKNTLAEIEKWANERDLQLLIERPDFEASDFKYELLMELSQTI